MFLNMERVEVLIEEGMIRKQKHADLPLWIYNYTQTCQFAGNWTEETLSCRGIVLDKDDNLIARPFRKILNVEQYAPDATIWSEPFIVFPKFDGSLFISYPTAEGIRGATRGSFGSEQAIRGNEMLIPVLESGRFKPDPQYTYLWEILYPENRIVVDYGSESKLVFLAAINNETGENVFHFGSDADWPGERALSIDTGELNPYEFEKLAEPNAEGFVLYFPESRERIKFKFEEYKRLHKLVTGTNSKTVWEALRDGLPLEELYERVPDEFFGWLKGTEEELVKQYRDIREEAFAEYSAIPSSVMPAGYNTFAEWQNNRAAFAAEAKKCKYPSLMFAWVDSKDVGGQIWRMIKPVATKAFYQEKTDAE